MFNKQFLLLLLCLFTGQTSAGCVDIIIFSKDRPMQLYALLESIQQRISSVGYATVIYRADHAEYEAGYQIVKNDFPSVNYVKQGANPAKDFTPLTIQSMQESQSTYLMFAVDDDIVTEEVDLQEIAGLLDNHSEVYCFFLRLGLNITHSYMLNKPIPPASFAKIQENSAVYRWKFGGPMFGWNYPQNVDMTIYRKATVLKEFESLGWLSGQKGPRGPNILEADWFNLYCPKVSNLYGMCYEHSKIINVPANLVQSDALGNRNENSYSAEQLLAKFMDGYKIDIQHLYNYQGYRPHEPVDYHFIEQRSG